MEAGFVALTVLMAVIIGVVVGISIEKRRIRRRATQGVLVVNFGDEDGPYLFLRSLNVPAMELASLEQVVFDVEVMQ